MYKISSLLLLVVLLTGCFGSSESEVPEEIAALDNLTVIDPDSKSSPKINFKKVATYSDTDEVMIGRLSSTTVAEDGRVFIADGELNYIHVYHPDGTYLDSVGRQGKGPGEFVNIGKIDHDDNYLYALDWSQRRLNVIDLGTLNYSQAISLSTKGQNIDALTGTYPSGYHVRNDGSFLIRFNKPYGMDASEDEERKNSYYLMDKEGRFEKENFFEQKVNESLIDRDDNSIMFMSSPFGRESLFVTGADDRIYTAWTEDFLIKVYSPEGSYERSYYMPYTKSPLDIGEVLKDYEGERQRKMIRNADAPDTWPALNSLEVDDRGRMWISTITDDRKTFDWWVINEEGELLARFTWPQNRQLISVKGDYLYTEETDKKTGLRQVVRYRVEI